MQVVVNIQPQTFKSSYVKLIVLLSSLIYSLLFSIFSKTSTTYIASLTVFIILGVVYLITATAYILIRNVKNEPECSQVVWLAYLFGGILYYVGRNLLSLAIIIPSCTSSCLHSIPATQSILLGTSVVIYRFIPFFISKYYQSKLAKEHQTTEAKLQLAPEWILAAESLTLLVEFDALYTVMISSFSGYVCAQVIAAWVLWALFVLMYTFILYYTMNIQYCGNCNANWNASCVAPKFGAIFVLAAFSMYLLPNNLIPLYCSARNGVIVQIVMRILVLIVVITAIVLLLVYRRLSKTQQEKLLPQTLYQQLHSEPDEPNDLPLETITM